MHYLPVWQYTKCSLRYLILACVFFQVTPNPGTMFNIPNLIEDREYDFRVIAVNEAGESRPTECGRSVKVKDPKGQS